MKYSYLVTFAFSVVDGDIMSRDPVVEGIKPAKHGRQREKGCSFRSSQLN